jgi:HEAT repeat protein
VEGLPGVIAFALGTLGGPDNLHFLAEQVADPRTAIDTQWSIADSLLLFNPADVTEHALTRMRGNPNLHALAAYMIGRLRIATPDSPEMKFLVDLLQSADVNTRGVAVKALGRLGETRYREDCELMASNRWDQVSRRGLIAVPRKTSERTELRIRAIETLRLIGTRESLEALRNVRNWRPRGSAGDRDTSELVQLSYEVSEDIYWRVTGGLEGDFLEPLEHGPSAN